MRSRPVMTGSFPRLAGEPAAPVSQVVASSGAAKHGEFLMSTMVA